MKKMFFLLVALSFAVSFSFGKVTNAQIADLISKNVKINNLKNPDLIYPGQPLLFNTKDNMTFLHVRKGENLWILAKKILIYEEKSKNYIPKVILPAVKVYKVYMPVKKPIVQNPLKSFSVWGWAIITLIAAVLSYLASKHDKEKKKLDIEI